jgi:hypothetical protein
LGQTEDYYLGPEVAGDIMLGQSFQPDCAGLNRVSFTLGIYQERHDQPVIFHLYSQTDEQEILTEEFSTEHLTDRTRREFLFEPQLNSHQQSYLAYFNSPTSHPGNNITLRGFSNLPVDWYPNGTAVVGQGNQWQPFPGDLAFTAFCDATLSQTINIAFSKLPGNPLIYWILLVSHGVILCSAVFQIVQLLQSLI